MPKQPAKPHHASADGTPLRQVAALPYRTNVEGEIEVLLISSRGKKRVIIPKGWQESKKPWKAAEKEAREEAGVVGKIQHSSIGYFEYWKRLRDSLRAGGGGRLSLEGRKVVEWLAGKAAATDQVADDSERGHARRRAAPYIHAPRFHREGAEISKIETAEETLATARPIWEPRSRTERARLGIGKDRAFRTCLCGARGDLAQPYPRPRRSLVIAVHRAKLS